MLCDRTCPLRGRRWIEWESFLGGVLVVHRVFLLPTYSHSDHAIGEFVHITLNKLRYICDIGKT